MLQCLNLDWQNPTIPTARLQHAHQCGQKLDVHEMNEVGFECPALRHDLLDEYYERDGEGCWWAHCFMGGTVLPGGSQSGAEVRDAESQITLGLLDAVQQNATHSQRTLASELGIALGLTNAYLRRCVGKGWIKVTRAPANRYLYYLTPKGFAEKGRLTARYLKTSFHFYATARNELSELIETCAAANWHRIALAGADELAEIALLCVMQFPSLRIIGVLDADRHGTRFLHVPLARKLEELGSVHAVILTHMREPQAVYDALVDTLPAERVLVPTLLKVWQRDRSSEIAP